MNKILIILFSLGLAVSASAQPKIGGTVRQSLPVRSGGYGNVKSNVRIVVPAYPMYPAYGYGYGYRNFYGYNSLYSPYYDPFIQDRRVEERPSALDLAIDDIKEEYDYKISTVKHDKNLEKDARKQQVRDLKHEKENAINDAKKSYYNKKDKQAEDND